MKTTVRIHRTFTEKGKLKAIASINLEDAFNIHNIRLIEGVKGYFLSMPDRRKPDGGFRDICYPTNSDFRNTLTESVVSAYEEKRKEIETE